MATEFSESIQLQNYTEMEGNHQDQSKNTAEREQDQHQLNDPKDSSKPQNPDFKEYLSPFKLPNDEEVFMYNENQKKKKNDQKSKNKKMKIWDKKTANSKNPLHHYKKFEGDLLQEQQSLPKIFFNQRAKNLINQANEIIKDRAKAKQEKKKNESIIDLIDQKKEMFLVTMSHGIIEHEIQKLKQIANEKDEALEQSKKMLDQDHEHFNRFVESNKKMAEQAQQRADNETNKKKIRDYEIKNINNQLTSLKAEISRNEELVLAYKEHKDFLDRLAPKEWLEQRIKRRNEKIEEAEAKFIEREMQKAQEEEYQEAQALKGLAYPKNQNKNKVIRCKERSYYEEQFHKLLNNGEIDEIEQFDDEYETYFTHPQQLVDIFTFLEEKNIFMIQMTQEKSQKLDELKTSFKEKKRELEKKMKINLEQKEILSRQLEEVDRKIVDLKLMRDSNKISTHKEDNILPIKKKLIELYLNFKEDIGQLGDIENVSALQLLSTLEIYLTKLIKQKRQYPPELVEKYRVQQEKKRKAREREERDKLKHKIDEVKSLKNKMKLLQPSKKRFARIDMKRSAPLERVFVEEKPLINNEEEEDKKYFQE